jgi:hypothetical protein
MAFINFNPGPSQTINQFNDLVAELQKQEDRFKYPKGAIGSKDELNKLLAFCWKGIYFPTINISTDVTRDVVEHKYPNRDSARLEDTGRNPIIVKAQCVFVNTINPGIGDGWKKGTLYPDVYRKFLLTSFENTTGILTHPFIGNIQCKLLSISSNIDSKFRGGEIVNATWKETIFSENIDDTLQSIKSSLNEASQSAQYIDDSFAKLKPDPKKLGLQGAQKDSLVDTLNKIKAAIDTGTTFSQSVLASFDKINYQCNSIIAAIKRQNDVFLSVLNSNVYKLKSCNQDLKKETLTNNKNAIGIYLPTTPMTWSSLSKLLNNTIEELAKLNASMIKKPTVSNITVYYYKK